MTIGRRVSSLGRQYVEARLEWRIANTPPGDGVLSYSELARGAHKLSPRAAPGCAHWQPAD